MNVSINCNSLATMSESDFALFLVRLMAINQAIPVTSQAPIVQAPTIQRASVQTINKGAREAQYNAVFGKALRVPENLHPDFVGKSREEIASICLDAGTIAGMYGKGQVFSIAPSEKVEVESEPTDFENCFD